MYWTQNAKLLAASTISEDQFGHAIAVNGNTLVVGAARGTRDGKAHVFIWNNGSWKEQTLLIPSRTTPYDAFGHAVAIDGDTIVVGAPYDNQKTGAAYLFQRYGTTWQEVAKLTASDAQPFAMFSYGSVAIDGDTIAIAAVDADSRRGAVYIFTKDNQAWKEQAKLIDPEGQGRCRFGYRLKLLGNILAVGHDIVNLCQGIYGGGRVHLFQGENNHWEQRTILRPDDNSRFFGHAVSLSHDLLVVGAFFEDTAYVFSRREDNWVLDAILKEDVSPNRSWFGFAVFTDGNFIAIGAPYANILDTRSGAVHTYICEDNNWKKQATIIGSDIKATEAFGSSVTGNQSMLIVSSVHNQARGYDTGAVYSFISLDGAAVLGGQSPLPIGSAVLGGLEGIKRRLASEDNKIRIAALFDALNYGEEGLKLVFERAKMERGVVQQAAIDLLYRKASDIRKT